MASFKTATPYIASYVIFRRGAKGAFVLRGHTGWMDGCYGLVAGKVEKGESYLQAAVREAKEEAGVTINPTDLQHVMTMHRRGEDGTEWVDIFFEASKWQGEPRNNEPKVHDELAWLELDDLPENMVPAVKHALDEIGQGKMYTEYGWPR